MGFERFQSICADCGRPVPAAYIRSGAAVYVVKNCPEHGESRALASEDAEAFERWLASPSVTVPPRVFVAQSAGEGASIGSVCSDTEAFLQAGGVKNTECPLHCGPCKNHLMTACCVLLNVTERCNQRCPWCFAGAGPETPAADETSGGRDTSDADPPLERIGRWLDRLTELGEERKFNIQLSGGEPTVRGDLPDVIGMCKAKGFEYVQLNTNGRRLAEDPAYAKGLKAAGLSTVFLQFDGVSDDVYRKLRGEPLFALKKTAVRNCGAAGLPVTLVPTVLKSVNLSQTGAIIDFMLDNITVVKGVHFQPASFFGRRPGGRSGGGDYDERVTMFAVMNEIERQTGGRVRKADLAPISTGHPLCCFCAAYMKEADGGLRPLSSGGSCCAPAADPLDIVRRDRDFVLNKWDVCAHDDAPGEPQAAVCGCETKRSGSLPAPDAALSFDEALTMFKSSMFTISGMAFMDETNLDAERLRRCRVQVFSADERLIPFCGYYTGRKEKHTWL